MKFTGLRDTNGLAGQHITQQLKTQNVQRHTLRSDHVLATAPLALTLSDHQRTNTVGIPECHETEAGDQRHCGVTALAALVDHLDGIKNIGGGGLQLTQTMQLMGKHIEQNLGIRVRIKVSKIGLEQFLG